MSSSPPSFPAPPHPERHRSKAAGHALTAAAVVAIGFATLTHGDPAVVEDTSLLCIVCGRHGFTDVVLNLVLFLPLGVGLRLAGVRPWTVTLAGALLSLAVESLQYTWLTGRSASLSDLLFNTTGATLGAMVVHWGDRLLRPDPRTAVRLAIVAVLVSIALISGSGWALVPHLGSPPYAVNQIAASPGAMRLYEASILRSAIDGREHPPPRRIRGALQLSENRPLDPTSIALEAEALPQYPPGMLRPLVLVSGSDSSTLVLLGQRERSLVLRLRVRGASLRLVTPTFALPGAFPGLGAVRAADSVGAAPMLRLAATHTSGAVALSRDGPEGTVTRMVARSPLLGWTLLTPFGIAHGRNGDLITMMWALLLLLPGAYWSGRARRAASWAPLAQFLVVLSAIALVARAFSLALPTGLPLTGVFIAAWGGAALGAWSTARLASPSPTGQVTAS